MVEKNFWACECGSGLDRYERGSRGPWNGRFLGWACPKCDPDNHLSEWQLKAINARGGTVLSKPVSPKKSTRTRR